LAVNRQELVDAYLGQHGRVAFGGVSPLFKWAFDEKIAPLPFDVEQAGLLLKQDGWTDSNGDGVLERGGVRFEFALKVPAGNQLRTVVATAVQQQLKRLNIEMRIEQVERGTFWQEVTTRQYDAWLCGFSVPLQMQLDDLWGSDLEKYPFNLVGFQDPRVDKILVEVKRLRSEPEGASLWKEFQQVVHEEQPCTFLFWINSIVAINVRVQGAGIGVLGTTHGAWSWHVGAPDVVAALIPR
jgi:peptide/nickel transport system substrate-binding protein